jgi:hypothetical protein
MSATPIAADHSEEFEQLAGLSALRVLDGDDQERFERHAAQCERCRLIVRSDRETLGNLSLAAPEMEPSPDFKRRLMDRAAAELASQPAPVSRLPADAASADISSIEAAPGASPRPADAVPERARDADATRGTPVQPTQSPGRRSLGRRASWTLGGSRPATQLGRRCSPGSTSERDAGGADSARPRQCCAFLAAADVGDFDRGVAGARTLLVRGLHGLHEPGRRHLYHGAGRRA